MNNNSNHNTVWILGLVVVLVLGVLIGTNMKKPSMGVVADEQQGAVIQKGTVYNPVPTSKDIRTGKTLVDANITITGVTTNKIWYAGQCEMFAPNGQPIPMNGTYNLPNFNYNSSGLNIGGGWSIYCSD